MRVTTINEGRVFASAVAIEIKTRGMTAGVWDQDNGAAIWVCRCEHETFKDDNPWPMQVWAEAFWPGEAFDGAPDVEPADFAAHLMSQVSCDECAPLEEASLPQ
jgi:hypothetical protein